MFKKLFLNQALKNLETQALLYKNLIHINKYLNIQLG